MERDIMGDIMGASADGALTGFDVLAGSEMNGMKRRGGREAMETAFHILFLLCGAVAMVFVLFISVYLIVSGLPAIREIGLMDFLFGRVWDPTNKTSGAEYGICPSS